MTGEQWEKYLKDLEGKYVVLYDGKIGQIHNPYEKKRGSVYFELLNNEDPHAEYNMTSLLDNTIPVDKLEDLIEPMDLLYVDISPDNCGGIVVPRVPETLNEVDSFKMEFAGNCYILKGIVKHQFLTNQIYWKKEEKSFNEPIEKCCICKGQENGEFITLNNKKYHLNCIEHLVNEENYLIKHCENQREEIVRLQKQQTDNIKKHKYTKQEIKDLRATIANLEEIIDKEKVEKENLVHIVANKIIEDYDIESPLKDELNNERMKILGLTNKNNILDNIINTLEKEIREDYDSLKAQGAESFARHGIEDSIVTRYERDEELLYRISELKEGANYD